LVNVVQKLLDAANIVSGLATVGGVLGWGAGVIWRLLLRRPVPFAEWVLHGAGLCGMLGLLLATAYLAL
jgi:hypothetical protein